jgi:ketosteroid isomerase-like protein
MTIHRIRPTGLALLLAVFLVPDLARGQRTADPALQRHDELIAADRALADSVMVRGAAGAIAGAGAPDLVLLFPGAPVVSGREAVRQLLEGQGALRNLTIRWVPLHGEVSRDGTFGVTYGVTGIGSAAGSDGPPIRFGKYLSAWRHEGDRWLLLAHVEVGLLPASSYSAPEGFAPPALPAIPASGPGSQFAGTDLAFAALAGKNGAPTAFATFAASDAVTFSSTGELNRGSAGIRRWLDGDDAAWSWRPVVSGGASDLGFTVGESVITPKGGAPSYGKYLTLWRREPGGKIRYLADGGNARPAPPKP